MLEQISAWQERVTEWLRERLLVLVPLTPAEVTATVPIDEDTDVD